MFVVAGVDREGVYDHEFTHVDDFYGALAVHREELVGALDYPKRVDRAGVRLDFVDYVRDVRVPDADSMVETTRKQKYKRLIKSQSHNTPCMLFINPFLPIINGIP